MKLTKTELATLYKRETARSIRGRAQCLSEDVLVRAAGGELSEPERQQMADHMLVCSDCAQEYQIVRSLKPWAEETARQTGELTAEARPADEVGVGRSRVRANEPGQAALWRWFGDGFSLSGAYAVAASLLLVSLGLAVWIVLLRQENRQFSASLNEERAGRSQIDEMRRRVEETNRLSDQYQSQIAELRRTVDALSQPQFNIPIVDLDPGDSVRGSAKAVTKTIALPPTANFLTLILNVAGQRSYSDYALEISDRNNVVVWNGKGLQRSPFNTFTVMVPRRLVPAGEYRIRLYGVNANRTDPIEDYSVRILPRD